MLRLILIISIGLIGFSGCSESGAAGSEAAARTHLEHAFELWMSGQESEAQNSEVILIGPAIPIGYEIRSVVPDKPYILAFTGDTPTKDRNTWPAYRLNVATDFKSESGSPLTKVLTYNLTWNPHEKRWYIKP